MRHGLGFARMMSRILSGERFEKKHVCLSTMHIGEEWCTTHGYWTVDGICKKGTNGCAYEYNYRIPPDDPSIYFGERSTAS